LLRVADFRELREGVNERSLSYRYDPELGWFPAPNSSPIEVWLVRHLWLARLANAVYLKIRHRSFQVPDPTERLVRQLRDFVQANDGKFFVGLQYRDPDLMRHLQAEQIPFVSFDGAEFYPGAAAGAHWTPACHKLVAERILGLLSANNIVRANVRSE
jgi:hypothetical protein